MRRRGIGLGTTLIVVALVATLGFIVVGTSVSHLQVMSRTSNAAIADDLARSVVNLALARVYKDRLWGTRPDEDRSLRVTLPDAPQGSEGLLTFDPSRTDIAISTNNIDGPTSRLDAAGKMVPSQSVLFVAEGRCRGVVRHVEAVLHVPPFPYATASDGPIVSLGGLQVGSIDPNTPQGTSVENLKPANMLSNATNAQAIKLGPDSTIKGDLLSAGGIELDPGGGTTVIGQLFPNSDQRTVPRLAASDYDPGPEAATLDPHYPQADFTGKLRRDGDLDVSGDLHLQGALLYVDGNLKVSGSLTGSGIVVTTGKMRVEGQAEMLSSDRVALLSQGGVELLGKGRASSNLRGVVYTEGGFTARQIRLEGALVSNKGDQVNPREVLLESVSLLKDDGASKVSIRPPSSNGPAGPYDAVHFDHQGVIFGRNTVEGPKPADFFYARLQARPDGQVDWYACEHKDGVQQCVYQGTGRPEDIYQPGHCFYIALQGKLPAAEYQQMLDNIFGKYRPGTLDPGEEAEAGEVVTVDPSRLLPLADSARIVLWRQY